MLDSHPLLAIPPETQFIPALAQVWRNSPRPRSAVVERLLRNQRWGDFDIDGESFAARVEEPGLTTLTDVLRLFYSTYAALHGKARWGDKTPNYAMCMPLIAELLPEAHFVHLIRDGRDVALSVRSLWFGPDTIEQAAVYWKERVETARLSGAKLPYIEVRYESLVVDPPTELMRLCRFLGLDFADEMLVAHRRAGERLAELKDLRFRGVSAARRLAIHERVRTPPQRDRIGRWMTEMTAEERRGFAAIAGPLLRELGYPG